MAQTEIHEIMSEKTTYFPLGVVKHWKRFPEEVVESPSVEIFKTQLDVVLGNLL